MATDTKPDNKIDEAYNAGHGTFSNPDAGTDQAKAFANDPKNHQDVQASENEPAGDWTNNVKDGDKSNKKSGGAFKKKCGIFGLIGVFGVSGGMMALVLPASLPVALTNMLGDTNDSASTTMSRRTSKVLRQLLKKTPGDDGNLCNAKKISCKGKRISNKGLRKLGKAGIKAYDANGKEIKTRRFTSRYPKGGNPASYRVDGVNKNLSPKELNKHIAANKKLAAKLYGRFGSINMRVNAWAGKYITKKFFNKFGIKRDGGIADGKHKKTGKGKSRLARAKEKFKSKIKIHKPASTDVSGRVSSRVSSKLKKAGKKGGAIYLTTFALCLGSKVPALISAGIASYQLLQLLPLISDNVLSPGTKIQASGVDKEHAATPEDVAVVGALLTNKDKNGKSALDSDILQSALGINQNKPSVEGSEQFIPGYSALQNKELQALKKGGDFIEPMCNVVMNPITMYVAMGVSTIVKSNPVGAIASFIGGFIVQHAAGPLIGAAVKAAGGALIKQLAQTGAFDNLEGEELGDALGVSAMAFYNSGSKSRLIPGLAENQLAGYQRLKNQELAEQRAMDIASLSPFDTSSPYTFLGNIVHSSQKKLIASGVYGSASKISTILSSMFQLPLMALTPNVGAASLESRCSYASAFDLETDDGETPAISISGLPCTGITDVTNRMSPERATEVLLNKGWLNDSAEASDDATIEDLVESGVIKKDSPMGAFIEACGDASSGEYIYESAGCVIPQHVSGGGVYADKDSPTKRFSIDIEVEQRDGSTTTEKFYGDEKDKRNIETGDLGIPEETDDESEAYQAMAVWLIDYQVTQSINGINDSNSDVSFIDDVDNYQVPDNAREAVTHHQEDSSIKTLLNNSGLAKISTSKLQLSVPTERFITKVVSKQYA